MGDADDTDRFADVVLPYLGEALTLARWLAGSRADADDIVQEACLRAFRAIGGFRGGSARAWLLTIVRNTAFTWLAKNRPVAFVAFDDLPPDERERAEGGVDGAGGTPATPETELLAQVDAERLQDAIAKLPDEFREVLVLRDLQGLDYREIATVTGAPIGTVMSRLARARQRIIRLLGDERL